MRHPKRVSVQNATAELRMAAFLQTAVAEADARRFETVLSWWTQAQPMQVCAHHCMRHDTTRVGEEGRCTESSDHIACGPPTDGDKPETNLKLMLLGLSFGSEEHFRVSP
jgi:hypothetical protein